MVKLNPGEKLLIQRLLAEQCVTEKHALKMWNQYHEQGMINSDSLQDSLIRCNSQLKKANMEVMGCAFPNPGGDQEGGGGTTTYVALIDKYRPAFGASADDDDAPPNAAKLTFVKSTLGGTIALNHRRAVLEHLATNDSAPRSALINLRNELQDATTYTLDAAEHCVDSMVSDHWLIPVGGGKKNRRMSMKTELSLGPRSYMELSSLLTQQFDMDASQLPQQLYYRS